MLLQQALVEFLLHNGTLLRALNGFLGRHQALALVVHPEGLCLQIVKEHIENQLVLLRPVVLLLKFDIHFIERGNELVDHQSGKYERPQVCVDVLVGLHGHGFLLEFVAVFLGLVGLFEWIFEEAAKHLELGLQLLWKADV